MENNFEYIFQNPQDWKQSAQKFKEDSDMGLIEEEKCKNCGAKYKNRRHLRYHENNCKVLCTDCGMMLKDRKSLIRHINLHRNAYQCHICLKSFGEHWLLRRHTNIHESPQFTCDICKFSCNQKSNLLRHKKTQHPEF